jgi:hypothetical protein
LNKVKNDKNMIPTANTAISLKSSTKGRSSSPKLRKASDKIIPTFVSKPPSSINIQQPQPIMQQQQQSQPQQSISQQINSKLVKSQIRAKSPVEIQHLNFLFYFS